MANLTADRNTIIGEVNTIVERSGPAGAATFYKGGAVAALTDRGVIVPIPNVMTGAVAVGIFDGIGSGSAPPFTVSKDGADRVQYKSGAFWFDNSSSSDEIKFVNVGALAYFVDDHTVAKTSNSGNRMIAGRVIDVQSGTIGQPRRGVLVHVAPTIPSGSTV